MPELKTHVARDGAVLYLGKPFRVYKPLAYSTDKYVMVDLMRHLSKTHMVSIGYLKGGDSAFAHIKRDQEMYITEAPTPMLAVSRIAVLTQEYEDRKQKMHTLSTSS